MTKLFVYGTLMNPNKVAVVLGRRDKIPTATPAVLKGYRKHSLDILEDPEGTVNGFVMDVEDKDMKKFDVYECVASGLYKLIHVDVETKDGKDEECVAYTLVDKVY